MNTRKKEIFKRKIINKHGCSGHCSRCTKLHILVDKMAEANIPAGYWPLTMRDFSGSEKLKEIVESYNSNINTNYENGISICLAGNQGTGKTMSSLCILKMALKNGYSGYYTTASDILNELTGKDNRLRHFLKNVDFLVIDELDSRFFTSNSAKELFSGIYENIFRTRAHNLLPTIICTNETEGILNVFFGPGIQSIDSLNKQYLTIYPVVGLDFRKKMGQE